MIVKQLLAVKMELRNDAHGSGIFGAPRGTRSHRGLDLVCRPNSFVLCPVDGTITKFGYCYGDDLKWRYVEVTNELRYRFFYTVLAEEYSVGQLINAGTPLMVTQDISEKWGTDMLPHVHLEVINPQGEYLNPLTL